jgi:hypothetical protein
LDQICEWPANSARFKTVVPAPGGQDLMKPWRYPSVFPLSGRMEMCGSDAVFGVRSCKRRASAPAQNLSSTKVICHEQGY